MSILLPSPRSRQPNYPVLVDSSNSITKGLIVSTAMSPAGAAYDSSRRGRNSNIITSSSVTRKSGSSGTNLDFNGSQAEASVSFGNISFHQFLGLTIEVDFVVRSLVDTVILVGKRTGLPCFLFNVQSSGRLSFSGYFAGGVFLTWQSADSSIVVNKQTHCIFSFRNQNGFMYINGLPVTLARNDGPTPLSLEDDNAAPLQLGRFDGGSPPGLPLTGSISLANVWDRGLSDAEAYTRYINRWGLFASPKSTLLSNFSGTSYDARVTWAELQYEASGAPVTPTDYSEPLSRGIFRGIERGVA